MPVVTTLASRGRLAFAWAGGALFVVSLLYFAWFYLIHLGRAVAPAVPPAVALAIDVGLFGLFGLHHSVMARPRVKRWAARVVGPDLERVMYVWVSSVMLILVCAWWQRLPGVFYEAERPWSWLLYGTQAAGILLTVRASGRLDVLELAGIRQAQAARRTGVRSDDPPGERSSARMANPLQMSGPYRLVRHPVYLGWIMIVFGTPVMTTDRMVFAAISTIYLVIATPLEERALRQAFGASYDEYAKRVRWRIVPGLY
jgi:protein-S-isoprenylcysteine O-methyltransferase Ste14